LGFEGFFYSVRPEDFDYSVRPEDFVYSVRPEEARKRRLEGFIIKFLSFNILIVLLWRKKCHPQQPFETLRSSGRTE
jgi:hypothetical protein